MYDRALEVAERLAQGPKEALSFTKHALNHWLRSFHSAFGPSGQSNPHFDASLALGFLGFYDKEVEEKP